MPSFSVDKIGNVKKAQRRLAKAAREIPSMDTTMKMISVQLDRWVQKNFKSEGSKVGKWDKLKAGGRRKKGGGFDSNAKILQDTGRLRASFKPFFSKDNAGIGSDLPYSAVHEKGLNGMKKRRMLPDKSDKEVIIFVSKLMGRHVKKAFDK